jgi:hypothetical protein
LSLGLLAQHRSHKSGARGKPAQRRTPFSRILDSYVLG